MKRYSKSDISSMAIVLIEFKTLESFFIIWFWYGYENIVLEIPLRTF